MEHHLNYFAFLILDPAQPITKTGKTYFQTLFLSYFLRVYHENDPGDSLGLHETQTLIKHPISEMESPTSAFPPRSQFWGPRGTIEGKLRISLIFDRAAGAKMWEGGCFTRAPSSHVHLESVRVSTEPCFCKYSVLEWLCRGFHPRTPLH